VFHKRQGGMRIFVCGYLAEAKLLGHMGKVMASSRPVRVNEYSERAPRGVGCLRILQLVLELALLLLRF